MLMRIKQATREKKNHSVFSYFGFEALLLFYAIERLLDCWLEVNREPLRMSKPKLELESGISKLLARVSLYVRNKICLWGFWTKMNLTMQTLIARLVSIYLNDLSELAQTSITKFCIVGDYSSDKNFYLSMQPCTYVATLIYKSSLSLVHPKHSSKSCTRLYHFLWISYFIRE